MSQTFNTQGWPSPAAVNGIEDNVTENEAFRPRVK